MFDDRKCLAVLSIWACAVRCTYGGGHSNEIHVADLPGREGLERGRTGALLRGSTQLAHELKSKGQFVSTSPLQPISTATCVKIRDGKRLVTDGPFAEAREQLGGYYMVDVKDLHVAISIAARVPGARMGTVEIRPVIEISGLPEG
jgi:hypothetical protein